MQQDTLQKIIGDIPTYGCFGVAVAFLQSPYLSPVVQVIVGLSAFVSVVLGSLRLLGMYRNWRRSRKQKRFDEAQKQLEDTE
jgi:hypothetical protein